MILWIRFQLWNTFHRPDLAVPACRKSLGLLGLEYLDLYLMHWPFTFKVKRNLIFLDSHRVSHIVLQRDGFSWISSVSPATAVTVSATSCCSRTAIWWENRAEWCGLPGHVAGDGDLCAAGFDPQHRSVQLQHQKIDRLLAGEIKPVNLQVRWRHFVSYMPSVYGFPVFSLRLWTTPFCCRLSVTRTWRRRSWFCQSRDITVTVYSPIGSPDSPYFKAGMPRLLEDPNLQQVAHRVGKSVGQIVFRYLVGDSVTSRDHDVRAFQGVEKSSTQL
jgi:hypothetical protein